MDKVVIVIDRDKIPDDRIYWKADSIYELVTEGSGFWIEKHRYIEYNDYRVVPYPIKELSDFITCNKSGEATDRWLLTEVYLE